MPVFSKSEISKFKAEVEKFTVLAGVSLPQTDYEKWAVEWNKDVRLDGMSLIFLRNVLCAL